MTRSYLSYCRHVYSSKQVLFRTCVCVRTLWLDTHLHSLPHLAALWRLLRQVWPEFGQAMSVWWAHGGPKGCVWLADGWCMGGVWWTKHLRMERGWCGGEHMQSNVIEITFPNISSFVNVKAIIIWFLAGYQILNERLMVKSREALMRGPSDVFASSPDYQYRQLPPITGTTSSCYHHHHLPLSPSTATTTTAKSHHRHCHLPTPLPQTFTTTTPKNILVLNISRWFSA